MDLWPLWAYLGFYLALGSFIVWWVRRGKG